MRTPDPGEGSASQRTLTARSDFWAAAFALADREIPGNPISTLKTAVWPKWQEIVNSRPPGRFRYLSLHAQEAKAEPILEAWARQHNLTVLQPSGELVPPDWVLLRARALFELWNQQKSLEQSGADHEFFGPTRLGTQGLKALPPLLNEYLLLAMPNPKPQPGESWQGFKSRVLSALKPYYGRFQKPDKPKHKIMPASKAAERRHTHFGWLILFQCCGLKQEAIRKQYPHINSYQAISEAIRKKARLLGLTLRTFVAAQESSQQNSR